MADRAALADKLERLLRETALQFRFYAENHRAKRTQDGNEKAWLNAMWADRLDNDGAAILAALREPGFTPEQEVAIKRVDTAALRAVEKVAHQRGAEAMREADVARCLSTALTFRQMGIENTARAFESQAEMIRLAPLPEPKP